MEKENSVTIEINGDSTDLEASLDRVIEKAEKISSILGGSNLKVFCPYCGKPVTCSCCGEPIRTREALEIAIEEGHNRYCGHCGHEIASTLAEVLANGGAK